LGGGAGNVKLPTHSRQRSQTWHHWLLINTRFTVIGRLKMFRPNEAPPMEPLPTEVSRNPAVGEIGFHDVLEIKDLSLSL
jgi:hypothetical protein